MTEATPTTFSPFACDANLESPSAAGPIVIVMSGITRSPGTQQ
jgi:hypothetical protein